MAELCSVIKVCYVDPDELFVYLTDPLDDDTDDDMLTDGEVMSIEAACVRGATRTPTARTSAERRLRRNTPR
ncbi:MAG: hypothetical protein VCC19_00300 [Myxococcota bacterium]